MEWRVQGSSARRPKCSKVKGSGRREEGGLQPPHLAEGEGNVLGALLGGELQGGYELGRVAGQRRDDKGHEEGGDAAGLGEVVDGAHLNLGWQSNSEAEKS